VTLPCASVVSLPPLPSEEQLKEEKRMVEPVTCRAEVVALVALKLPAKKLAVVAFCAVKFWKVEEPRARMFERVARALAWSELVVILPAWRFVVEAVPETTSLVVLKEEVVARVADRSLAARVPTVSFVVEAVFAVKLVVARFEVVAFVAKKFVKYPAVPRTSAEKKLPVEVAAAVVAFVPVKFWKVEEARERRPPLAVVRPVTLSVEPRVAAPWRFEVPSTASVPVALTLVTERFVAMVVEETERVPEIEELPRVSVLPRISMMFPVVVVAEAPMRTTFPVLVV